MNRLIILVVVVIASTITFYYVQEKLFHGTVVLTPTWQLMRPVLVLTCF